MRPAAARAHVPAHLSGSPPPVRQLLKHLERVVQVGLGVRGGDADAHARRQQRRGGEAHHHDGQAAVQRVARHRRQLGGVEDHDGLRQWGGGWVE